MSSTIVSKLTTSDLAAARAAVAKWDGQPAQPRAHTCPLAFRHPWGWEFVVWPDATPIPDGVEEALDLRPLRVRKY